MDMLVGERYATMVGDNDRLAYVVDNYVDMQICIVDSLSFSPSLTLLQTLAFKP